MSSRKRAADVDGRLLCPHCDQSVAERTYWLHKRRYYDSAKDRWLKDGNVEHLFSDSDDASLDLHSCADDRELLLMESDIGEQDDTQETMSFASSTIRIALHYFSTIYVKLNVFTVICAPYFPAYII